MFGLPRVLGRLHLGVGLQVEQVDHEIGTRDAVDDAVMHLGDEGHVAVLQALGHPHLP